MSLWRRGSNTEHAIREVQRATDEMVEWSFDWGVQVLSGKKLLLTKKRTEVRMKLRMYRKDLERKKTINVMRCLTGG